LSGREILRAAVESGFQLLHYLRLVAGDRISAQASPTECLDLAASVFNTPDLAHAFVTSPELVVAQVKRMHEARLAQAAEAARQAGDEERKAPAASRPAAASLPATAPSPAAAAQAPSPMLADIIRLEIAKALTALLRPTPPFAEATTPSLPHAPPQEDASTDSFAARLERVMRQQDDASAASGASSATPSVSPLAAAVPIWTLPIVLSTGLAAAIVANKYFDLEEVQASLTSGGDSKAREISLGPGLNIRLDASVLPRRRAAISSIEAWIQAFVPVVLYTAEHAPGFLRDRVAYIKTMAVLASKYGFASAHDYDIDNRKYCAQTGLAFSSHKGELLDVVRTTHDSIVSAIAHQSGANANRGTKRGAGPGADAQPSAKRPATSGSSATAQQMGTVPTATAPDGKAVCKRYNVSLCTTTPCPAGRAHVCASCLLPGHTFKAPACGRKP
jgi:hypothetical protein